MISPLIDAEGNLWVDNEIRSDLPKLIFTGSVNQLAITQAGKIFDMDNLTEMEVDDLRFKQLAIEHADGGQLPSLLWLLIEKLSSSSIREVLGRLNPS